MNKVHDNGPVELVDILFDLAPLLADQMATSLAENGLTLARSALLWRLHVTGPVSQRELAAALGVTPRNVTTLVDALESAGLLTRVAPHGDRRVRIVSLTESGEDAVRAMGRAREGFARDLFADVDPGDLAATRSVLATALALMHQRFPAPPATDGLIGRRADGSGTGTDSGR